MNGARENSENQATSHYDPGLCKVSVLLVYAAFWNCLIL